MEKDIKPMDENGLPHGYWEVYHEYDNIRSKGSYIHGNLYGLWEECYDNGNLSYKVCYINDKRHGLCESYYRCGVLHYSKFYYLGNKVYQTSKNKILL